MKMASNLLHSVGLFLMILIVLKTGYVLNASLGSQIQYSSQKIFVEIKDSIQLPCLVNVPARQFESYHWTLNDQPFIPDTINVVMLNSGALLFNVFHRQYTGFYKCFATNSLGTTVSPTVHLIGAELYPFSDMPNAPISKNAGESLRLHCPRPRSVPNGSSFWSKYENGHRINVKYDGRVLPDPQGGLNFAFVKPSDQGEYICSEYNWVLRKLVSSRPFNVTVIGDLDRRWNGDLLPNPNDDTYPTTTNDETLTKASTTGSYSVSKKVPKTPIAADEVFG